MWPIGLLFNNHIYLTYAVEVWVKVFHLKFWHFCQRKYTNTYGSEEEKRPIFTSSQSLRCYIYHFCNMLVSVYILGGESVHEAARGYSALCQILYLLVEN